MTCTAIAPSVRLEDGGDLGVARSFELGALRRCDQAAEAGRRPGPAASRAWTAPSRGALVGPRGAGIRAARAWRVLTGHIKCLCTARELEPDANKATRVYQITDRLHGDRSVQVPTAGIVPTVSAWLAELGAASPLVEDLADAVCAGDWPTTHALSDVLSVDVALAV